MASPPRHTRRSTLRVIGLLVVVALVCVQAYRSNHGIGSIFGALAYLLVGGSLTLFFVSMARIKQYSAAQHTQSFIGRRAEPWLAAHPIIDSKHHLRRTIIIWSDEQLVRLANFMSQLITELLQWLSTKLIVFTGDLRWVLSVYVASLPIAGYIFSVLEGNGLNPWTGIYWSSTTALTVGYGDISPHTVAGRVFAVLMQHFWIMCIAPLVIGHIVTKILPDFDNWSDFEQRLLFKALHYNVVCLTWLVTVIRQIALKVGVENIPPPPAPPDFMEVLRRAKHGTPQATEQEVREVESDIADLTSA